MSNYVPPSVPNELMYACPNTDADLARLSWRRSPGARALSRPLHIYVSTLTCHWLYHAVAVPMFLDIKFDYHFELI